MHTLLAVGVTILTATTPQPQPTLATTKPLTVTFVMPVKFDEAISFLAKQSGLTIEVDDTVPQDVRQQPVAGYALTLRDVTLEEAIAQLTKIKELSYTVVNEKTIRISKKA